jgi:23S rRNA (adenine2503-C2)-methyltransferase
MNLPSKTDIRSLSKEALKEAMLAQGEKSFRANQVYEWLWKKSASDFDEMSNLSLETREWLKSNYVINHVKVVDKQVSNDKTIKSGFQLHDTHIVEGVLIPATDRMTACVSSQVGCSLSCKFCATGKLDRIRNLNPDEIYDQVVHIRNWANKHYNQPLTNIVFMGMGEPLLNYKNVLAAIQKITSPEGLGMSNERITVSTAGIAKMIEKLADDKVKFRLAFSLHASND